MYDRFDDNKPFHGFDRPQEEGIRINKYLSDSGVCSRREADRLVDMGSVTIDGRIAQMGDQVFPGQRVLVNGIPAELEEERILIAFNKPVGIVCTAEKREKDNVIDYINYPKRIYPVGRLDKDSEGLLLLTNQGEIVNKMMRSGNMHEKEYIVTLWKPVTDSLLRGLAGGVPLVELGVTTRECFVERVDKFRFRIILTQGYNRQIRRMCEYFGYRVKELKRVRVMNIELGDLAPGRYREVTESEYRVLMRLIRDSSNTTVMDAPKKRFKTEKVQHLVDERPRRPEGERRPYGENRPYGERRPEAERRFESERKPFANGPRPAGPSAPNRPTASKPAGPTSPRPAGQEAARPSAPNRPTSPRPAGLTNARPVGPTGARPTGPANSIPPEPGRKAVFTSNASHSQSSAFEERQRLKAQRRMEREQGKRP